jgi:NADH dehydrogenase FAD-containing subunit
VLLAKLMRWLGRQRRDSDGTRPASTTSMSEPTVVIVGGGFGGLSAAKALRRAPVRVVLIDRTNHHLFQPLLYQVATSVLASGQIAAPIRAILAKQKNATVLMGEVVGVSKEKKLVYVSDADRKEVPVSYDELILATGATHNYFGHHEFAHHAPGLKTLSDAMAVRSKILQAFEMAEAEEDPRAHRNLLTFVLVGGGPAGVEMAGAISVLVRTSLRSQFRRVDPTSARIVLVDQADRVIRMFPEKLSHAARKRLENLGVEVRLGQAVENVDEDGVVVAGERIASRTVIWTAGVTPSPAGAWLNAETDRAGRVLVQGDLTVPGHPEIFVVGDTAIVREGRPVVGVAQVAIQQGKFAGRVIHHRAAGEPAPQAFHYFDKGTMAVVGGMYAVLDTLRGKVLLKGLVAWLVWAVVHVTFLAQPGLRVSVVLQWMWTFVTRQRGSRLIEDEHAVLPEAKPPHAHAYAE